MVKKVLILLMLCIPLMVGAQTETDRVAALQAEALAKAKAAQEAAKAAQEAAKAAQEAAEAAAREAEKAALEVEQKTEKSNRSSSNDLETLSLKKENAHIEEEITNESLTNSWVTPVQNVETEKGYTEKETVSVLNKDAEYLADNAVPVVDNDVQWELNVDVLGKNAKQNYDTMLQLLGQMTKEKNQLERSKIAIVNENKHSIVATLQEILTFSSSLLSLDQAKMNYVLVVNCFDNHVQVLMNRINYEYETQGKKSNYKAEEWITDKYCVNKKHTRLYPISGKFRKKTIDRKNEIFQNIRKALQ